jgi:hypothetical protein
MRDKNLNFIQFSAAVENFIESKHKISKDRRTTVVNSPTLLEEFYLVLPRKFMDFRNICITLHYIKEEPLRYRILLDMEERLTRFDSKKQLELKLLLHSKETMLKFLYLTRKYSSHEIFGNLINKGIQSLNNLKLKRRNTKILKTQRKRGYDDKGSLRPKEKWLEKYDFSFTTCQNEKEKKQYLHQKSITKLLKYLERTLIE